MMVKELKQAIESQPGLWVLLCVVVVVGGPAFVNQMAARYLPGAVQVEMSKDVEWIERRSNKFNDVLRNQKRILETLYNIQQLVEKQGLRFNSIEARMSRLEAYAELGTRFRRERSPGEYP